MALYPGAKHRLIPKWNVHRTVRYRRMNLHVAVSRADSLHGFFSRTDSACSHFYVALDGTVEQYIDTKYMSAADLDGSDSTISVETAGGVSNVNGEQWTGPQVRALIDLWAWARDRHGIPNQVARDTYTNEASAGLSWHRLGVRGNFDGRPGICSQSYGGILYSSVYGKECPGDAKILQVPDIWAAANDDGAGVVVAPAGEVEPVESAPSGPAPTDYPDLVVDGVFGPKTVTAFQIVMAAIDAYEHEIDGVFGRMTVRAMQRWLRGLGFYSADMWLIDGLFGPATVVGLQRFLVSKRMYAGVVDGDFGPLTIKALQTYLNGQNDF